MHPALGRFGSHLQTQLRKGPVPPPAADPSSHRLEWEDQSPYQARFPYLPAHPGGASAAPRAKAFPSTPAATGLGSKPAGHRIKGGVFKERQVWHLPTSPRRLRLPGKPGSFPRLRLVLPPPSSSPIPALPGSLTLHRRLSANNEERLSHL